MQYEASVRKLYQLSREIEERATYDNMQHSVWKLMSFLRDDVPGWIDAVDEYQTEGKPCGHERATEEVCDVCDPPAPEREL